MRKAIRIVAGAFLAAICAMPPAALAGNNAVVPARGSSVYQGQSPFVLASRNALVIGVPDLEDGAGLLALKNPAQDARAVSTALQAVGFNVINVLESVGSNREMTRHNIEKGIYDFAVTLQSTQGIGLIYFSGHGIQVGGQEYLYPYDGFVRYDRDIEQNLLPVSLLLDAFRAAGTSLNILVVDACRDNFDASSLPSFGHPYSPPSVSSSTDSVVTVYAALSGTKALDGSDTLSPLAKAFVDAVAKPDLTLAELFDSIGVQVHGIPAITRLQDVLNVTELPGREFVFTPTLVSYNRERQIYEALTASGKVEQMRQLLWQIPAGYFAAATAEWLGTHPAYVDPPPPPTTVVAATQDSNLRSAPALNAPVLGTARSGGRLLAAGVPVEGNGSQWLPIVGALPGVPLAYLRNDRARVLSSLPAPTLIAVDFVAGADAGTVQVSDAAMTHLRAAFGYTTLPPNSSVDVIGYTSLNDEEGRLLPSDTLLSRQAVVLSALHELGANIERLNVLLKKIDSMNADNRVVVTLHRGQ